MKPASHPANDSDESRAINLVESLLDPDYVKTEIKEHDKPSQLGLGS